MVLVSLSIFLFQVFQKHLFSDFPINIFTTFPLFQRQILEGYYTQLHHLHPWYWSLSFSLTFSKPHLFVDSLINIFATFCALPKADRHRKDISRPSNRSIDKTVDVAQQVIFGFSDSIRWAWIRVVWAADDARTGHRTCDVIGSSPSTCDTPFHGTLGDDEIHFWHFHGTKTQLFSNGFTQKGRALFRDCGRGSKLSLSCLPVVSWAGEGEEFRQDFVSLVVRCYSHNETFLITLQTELRR